MVTDHNGIEVEGLVREFKNGRAVDGIDLRVAPGEIYGFLGPNGAGKSTTVLMLTTLLPPTAGTARVAGFDIVNEGPRVRAAIGAALQEAALDPLLTGREHMRLQTALHGLAAGRARAARRRAARAGRPLGGGRPQGRRLLGRDEAPARPGAGARPPARASSSSTSRPPASTSRAAPRSGTRSRGSPRRRRHRLPHHPVPGGGRRARRPGRDHRPRPDRRRGHAGRAEGRDRPADRRGRARRPRAARPGRRRARAASASACRRSPDGVAVRLEGGESSWPRSSARSTPRGSRSSTCSCTRPRSTTSSSPRPAARWRAPSEAEAEADAEAGGGRPA